LSEETPKKEVARIEIVYFSDNSRSVSAPTNYYLSQQMLIDAMVDLLNNKVKTMQQGKKSIVVPNFIPPKNLVGGN